MSEDNPRYTDEMLPGVARAPIKMKRLTPSATLPRFRPQPRDLVIVRFTAANRFVTAKQAALYVGGSFRGVANRMRIMFDHQILDRPQHQYLLLSAFHTHGNPQLVYALGRRGAQLLSELGEPINRNLDWTQKNARVVPLSLTHEIEIAEIMLGFELACRDTGGALTLEDQQQLLLRMPDTVRAGRNPFACAVTVELPTLNKPIDLTNIPDRVFAIRYPDTSVHNFILEHDRGTMPVGGKRTRFIGRSSFRKKLIGYFHFWKQGLHTQRFNFLGFRVLTITTEKRIATMLAAQRDVMTNSASGLFLYSTPSRLSAHGPFGPAWVSSAQDRVSILPANLQLPRS